MDNNFINWLKQNKIKYDINDKDLIKALESEYLIELNSLGNYFNKK